MPLQQHPDGCNNCLWDDATGAFSGPMTPCMYCPGTIDVIDGIAVPLAKPAPEDGIEGPEAYDWDQFERLQGLYTKQQQENDARAIALFNQVPPS